MQVHVYVGGPAGSGAPGYAITANTSRPDVNNAYPGVGNNHGFSSTISVDRTGTQTIYIYAINVGGGNSNPLLGTRTVTIKGASNNGIDSQKRDNVVSYMNQMASIKWTSSKSFTHWSGGRIWYAGTYYYGIPYSHSSRNTNLESFKSYLSGSKYVGPSGQTTYRGSDCSSAVSMAWRTENSKFAITTTRGMYPNKSGMKAVGSYWYGTSTNASYICQKNGQSVMYQAYGKLQKGDAVLQNGHVMLVTGIGSNSIYVTHQTTYSSSLHSTWRVGQKWSYSSLYQNGYIPVTQANW